MSFVQNLMCSGDNFETATTRKHEDKYAKHGGSNERLTVSGDPLLLQQCPEQSHESVGLRNASLVADTENVKITTGSENQYARAIRCSMRSVNLCSIYELYKLI